MNFNVWNIKDMLSIPSGSGTTKSSNWTNNQTDYSSLSDSQFLFGSQFCPESSETLSAPLDVGVHLRDPTQLQKNSLDNEPSIFTKYQTKPQLFGEDIKDGGLFPLPLPVGKSKGLLEQFEEKKKIAKDKLDSETLYNFISHVRESICKLQTSVEKSEEHLSSRSQSILDSLETVAKTLQETVQAQSGLVLETAQDKGNVEQAILELHKRLEARQEEFIELKSSLKHLEVAVALQSKDFQQLCEQLGQLNVPSVLTELKSLISVPRVPVHVKDSTSQTSPPLPQSLNFTRQDKHAPEESATGQAQAIPAARNLRTGFLRPRKFGEGAKRAAVQEEATLLAAGGCKRNRRARDKAVQTNCENQLITKTSSGNHGTRDLVSQGALRLISLDLNNFVTSQKRQTKDVFSCDPSEQRLVPEQGGRTVDRRRKGQQPPRKAHRGRPLARKQEQTQSKARSFNSKCPQPLDSGSQRSPPEQQEPLAQPLHPCGPRNPTKPVYPALGGALTPRTMEAAQGTVLQLNGRSSQDDSQGCNSSKGDHEMSWFSDLNLESSQDPLCKQPGKNVLYDLGFDSSDDGF
ncbi:PREDICTED: coiled-coil domain-containing protein 36 [Miniopterus natalensis]|uniref:coiled-coil domain-containing protein 36 n=1 Tax=Miniopterus natalensis TaxID=291302 RepID=UPI0007A707C9|nr:PREDICTED: coiled-coil domain-containing protein 36 [Miniopterus natalensis]